MADKHNPDVPSSANVIATDIEDIKENLEFHKDAFENICANWSDSTASQVFPTHWNKSVVSANDTEDASHNIVEYDCSGGARTFTLRAAATAGSGRYLFIKLVDATNALTIDGDGAETIDGVASLVLNVANEAVMLYCDGTNWKVLFHENSSFDIANDTPISAIDNAGTGSVDIVKVNTSDEVEVPSKQAYTLLAEQAAAPTTGANIGAIYSKESFGKTSLFFREESDGTEHEMGVTQFPKGYLQGCDLSVNAVAPTTDIDITSCACRDSTDVTDIEIAAMTREIDGELGTGDGGMYVGGTVAANTQYYIYAIKKDSDGSGNVYFDTSATAANRSAGDTHTYYKQIGKFKTAASTATLGGDLGTVKQYSPKSQAYGVQMKTGTYTGDSTDDRDIDIGVDLLNAAWKWLIIKGETTTVAMHRVGHVAGDQAEWFTAYNSTSGLIQAWTDSGFQVGWTAVTKLQTNVDTITYNYVVFWQEI